MKVYTRTGDGGETSLFSGGRVGKDHHRLEAYGTLDELNSVLGVLRAEPLPDDVDGQLASVQETLFEIGSALADPELRIDHDHRAWDASPLERWIGWERRSRTPSAATSTGCRTRCSWQHVFSTRAWAFRTPCGPRDGARPSDANP